MRGGERVIERLLRLFPSADLITHVLDGENVSAAIRTRVTKTTFINRLPGSKKFYQRYLPLMPLALEELDLRGYDLVISSEAGPAKGVITSPDALHICYCHSPMRYLWDAYWEYKSVAGPLSRLIMTLTFHWLRQWDVTSAARVDGFIANSSFISRRIKKFYRREASVVYPPVAVQLYAPSEKIEPHYLWVGQMVPYKRADIAVEAFNRLQLPLVMVGNGPMKRVLEKAAGANIKFIDHLDYAELRALYARSRALIFTSEEDFGIIPVEVMASGRPVLAFGRGGGLESVVASETGLFFSEQTAASLAEGVGRMERWLPSFDPAAAITRAARFSNESFDKKFLDAVDAYAGDSFSAAREATALARAR